MLAVNYWNATIGVFGLDAESGAVGDSKSMYDPNEGRVMKVCHKQHVNHSENDPNAQKERQSDPHSHAVILDPFFGKIAYVPDLGMDLIRQFRFNPQSGVLEAAGTCRSRCCRSCSYFAFGADCQNHPSRLAQQDEHLWKDCGSQLRTLCFGLKQRTQQYYSLPNPSRWGQSRLAVIGAYATHPWSNS